MKALQLTQQESSQGHFSVRSNWSVSRLQWVLSVLKPLLATLGEHAAQEEAQRMVFEKMDFPFRKLRLVSISPA